MVCFLWSCYRCGFITRRPLRCTHDSSLVAFRFHQTLAESLVASMNARRFLLFLGALAIGSTGISAPSISWRVLQPGVEFSSVMAGKMASGEAGRLYVVRI